MSNYSFGVRTKRWIRFSINYIKERMRGLDFSMVYVGDIQKNVEEFHGYSMTDEKDMKRMLKAIPVNPSECSFLDVGCGKGICMKCAVESGYGRLPVWIWKALVRYRKKEYVYFKNGCKIDKCKCCGF